MTLSEFNENYDKYYLMVMKVAFNNLKDYHYAQDVCQEVFMSLYRNRESVSVEYVKPWLLVATKRKAIDYQRKKYVTEEACGEVPLITEQDSADVEVGYIQKEFGQEVLNQLRKKNSRWYEIVVRILIKGESQNSVAADLNVSLGSLQVDQHRAKLWLKDNFSLSRCEKKQKKRKRKRKSAE